MRRATLGYAAPFFVVRDVPRTLAFYRNKLGFELEDPDGFGLFFGRPQQAG